jgi:hypothetical protein
MPSFTFGPTHALTDSAILALISSLSTFGNTIDPDHRAALRRILDTFTTMAAGRKRGRSPMTCQQAAASFSRGLVLCKPPSAHADP